MKIRPNFVSCFRALMRDAAAGVTTIATLALPVVVGAAGLAFDLNRGYQQREINQRAADMAALGAALAYSHAGAEAVLNPTAQDIAIANGLADANVVATLLSDFPASGDQSVQVTISRELPFSLASVLGFSGMFNVSSRSVASLTTTVNYAAPCYLALSSGANAIKVSGGGTINAPGCSVAAVGSINNLGSLVRGADIIAGSGSINLDWGGLSANTLRFGGAFTKPAWNNNAPAPSNRINQATTLTDPWAADASRLAAMAQIGSTGAIPALTNPTLPTGSDWDFSWSPSSTVSAFRQGYTGNYIVPAGNHVIRRMTVAGGINVTFQNGSNIQVGNGIAIGGGSNVNFGNANLYVNGGFNSGSNGVTIGNGDLWIGSGTVIFQGTNTKGDGNVIVNSTVTLGGGQRLTMGAGNHYFSRIVLGSGGTAKLGNGNFVSQKGVQVGGGSALAIGTGDVAIGAHTDGNAIDLSGSAMFFMGNGLFSADGHIDTEGGSRLVFGEATNHYIDGNMNIRGAVLFGKGRYTISGNFINGTGGTTWPYTSSLSGQTYGNLLQGVSVTGYDMAGIDVTFVMGGVMNLAGGAKVKLEAANYTETGGVISELLVSSESTSDSYWTAGSVATFSGAIHLPNSNVHMGGGNATVSGSKCMSLIARTIDITGGAATGTSCAMLDNSIGGGSSGTPRLIG